MAKCDAFIVSRIIFSLVFARLGGRNDYNSFSINIGTNKLEHDLQDTSPFLSKFQLMCTIAEKDMSTFWIYFRRKFRSASHIASSKKAFVILLKSRPDVVKYIRKLTYTLEFNHVHAPQFSPHLNFMTIISSHPSFQISSEQFLISIASKSTLRFWTGIDWTLP